MGARTVLGDHLAASARDDLEVDAGFRERCLQRLCHVGKRRRVDDVEGYLDRRLDTGVGEDLLRLFDVVAVGRFIERAREALRPEGLVNFHLTLQEAVGHALVVHEVAGGFPDGFRL
ncbi:hypothetical protein D9M70_528910 [compost metagenome]